MLLNVQWNRTITLRKKVACIFLVISIATLLVAKSQQTTRGRITSGLPTLVTNTTEHNPFPSTHFDGILNACIDGSPDLSLWNAYGLYLSCFDNSTNVNAPRFTLSFYSSNRLSLPNQMRPDVEPWIYFDGLAEGINGKAFEQFEVTPGHSISMDRGHLVANNDFSKGADKSNTFIVFNRAPQLDKINRGYWRCIEQALRQVTLKKEYQCVYIVTRLLYDQDPSSTTVQEKDGGAITAIPESFNKIVYLSRAGANGACTGDLYEAFCISQQNREYDATKETGDQNIKVYPTFTSWNDCNETLKADLPIPTTTDNNFLKELTRKLLKHTDDPTSITCPEPDSCERPLWMRLEINKKRIRRRVAGTILRSPACPRRCSNTYYEEDTYIITTPNLSNEERDLLYEGIKGIVLENGNQFPSDGFEDLDRTPYYGYIQATCSTETRDVFLAKRQKTRKTAQAQPKPMVRRFAKRTRRGLVSQAPGFGFTAPTTPPTTFTQV